MRVVNGHEGCVEEPDGRHLVQADEGALAGRDCGAVVRVISTEAVLVPGGLEEEVRGYTMMLIALLLKVGNGRSIIIIIFRYPR